MKESRFQRDRQDPDIIRVQSGGGLLILFGIPFFCVGLLALLTCVGVLPLRGGGGEISIMAAGLFGAVFAGVGIVLIFGRSGLIIDRKRNQLVQWSGLIVPLKRIVHPLDRFMAVRMEREREEKMILYPILLKGERPLGTVRIEAPSDYAIARRTAEALARFLGKPMEDASSGRAVIRDPGRLDESFRDGFHRRREEVFFPPRPLTPRTGIEERAEGLILSIPVAPLTPRHFFPLAMALLLAGVASALILPVLLSLPAPLPVHYFLAGVTTLFVVLMPILAALRAIAKSRGPAVRITASPGGIRIEEKEGSKVRTTEIPSAELEDLVFTDRRSRLSIGEVPGMKKLEGLGDTGTPRLPDGRPLPKILLALTRLVPTEGITARSDRATVTFGQGLPEEELAYLFALLKKKLTD